MVARSSIQDFNSPFEVVFRESPKRKKPLYETTVNCLSLFRKIEASYYDQHPALPNFV